MVGVRPETARLYDVFASYASPGTSFCDFCYSPEEIRVITECPVASLGPDMGWKLLAESWDHWQDSRVYRHYLPRLLELMDAPWNLEDLYPLHLSETLLALDFKAWPPDERTAVLEYLANLEPVLGKQHPDKEQDEWRLGLERLRETAGLELGASGA